jgi:hypothetical protein
LFLDEGYLLNGALTGYVWGQSKIIIEVPITMKKIDKIILVHSIIKAKNFMFRAIHLVIENQQLNS